MSFPVAPAKPKLKKTESQHVPATTLNQSYAQDEFVSPAKAAPAPITSQPIFSFNDDEFIPPPRIKQTSPDPVFSFNEEDFISAPSKVAKKSKAIPETVFLAEEEDFLPAKKPEKMLNLIDFITNFTVSITASAAYSEFRASIEKLKSTTKTALKNIIENTITLGIYNGIRKAILKEHLSIWSIPLLDTDCLQFNELCKTSS